MSAIGHTTAKEFVSDVVESSVPVLVDFYADWCGPCRMLARSLERLARDYAGQVKFVKVNVDKEPELAGHFQVQSIPTLLAFRDGQWVDTLVGVGSPGQLRYIVTKLAATTVQPDFQAR
jgi:thioredoxin